MSSIYDRYFSQPRLPLGVMAGHVWETDPRRLGIVLARYKFVAKMLAGLDAVAEIGCGDGWAGRVVEQAVAHLGRYDADPAMCGESGAALWDITYGPLPGGRYDAVYALDVLEHIADVDAALRNMAVSVHKEKGVAIVGMPSMEGQKWASDDSRAGHVSCMTESELRRHCFRHFNNVFVFGMNDEALHTGFGPMCHYRIALCVGPR